MMPMILIPIIIFTLHIMVIRYVALWFILKKADEPGWASIIPVYNILLVIKIAGKPWWYILLLLIPIVNIIIGIMILHGLSKSFGKGGWFTVGLIFLRTIFMAVLGFGKAQYTGSKEKFQG
jgi:hypothetical protein